jgi:hypothetical protein
VLAAKPEAKPFEWFEAIFAEREGEADRFYDALFPRAAARTGVSFVRPLPA